MTNEIASLRAQIADHRRMRARALKASKFIDAKRHANKIAELEVTLSRAIQAQASRGKGGVRRGKGGVTRPEKVTADKKRDLWPFNLNLPKVDLWPFDKKRLVKVDKMYAVSINTSNSARLLAHYKGLLATRGLPVGLRKHLEERRDKAAAVTKIAAKTGRLPNSPVSALEIARLQRGAQVARARRDYVTANQLQILLDAKRQAAAVDNADIPWSPTAPAENVAPKVLPGDTEAVDDAEVVGADAPWYTSWWVLPTGLALAVGAAYVVSKRGKKGTARLGTRGISGSTSLRASSGVTSPRKPRRVVFRGAPASRET